MLPHSMSAESWKLMQSWLETMLPIYPQAQSICRLEAINTCPWGGTVRDMIQSPAITTWGRGFQPPHTGGSVPVSSHAPSVKEKVFIVPVGANSKPDPASPQQQPSQGLPQQSLHRPKLLAGTAVAPDTEWGLRVQG